nr:hypothetical protein [uncultured Agathobaculum sp.]
MYAKREVIERILVYNQRAAALINRNNYLFVRRAIVTRQNLFVLFFRFFFLCIIVALLGCILSVLPVPFFLLRTFVFRLFFLLRQRKFKGAWLHLEAGGSIFLSLSISSVRDFDIRIGNLDRYIFGHGQDCHICNRHALCELEGEAVVGRLRSSRSGQLRRSITIITNGAFSTRSRDTFRGALNNRGCVVAVALNSFLLPRFQLKPIWKRSCQRALFLFRQLDIDRCGLHFAVRTQACRQRDRSFIT